MDLIFRRKWVHCDIVGHAENLVSDDPQGIFLYLMSIFMVNGQQSSYGWKEAKIHWERGSGPHLQATQPELPTKQWGKIQRVCWNRGLISNGYELEINCSIQALSLFSWPLPRVSGISSQVGQMYPEKLADLCGTRCTVGNTMVCCPDLLFLSFIEVLLIHTHSLGLMSSLVYKLLASYNRVSPLELASAPGNCLPSSHTCPRRQHSQWLATWSMRAYKAESPCLSLIRKDRHSSVAPGSIVRVLC